MKDPACESLVLIGKCKEIEGNFGRKTGDLGLKEGITSGKNQKENSCLSENQKEAFGDIRRERSPH